MVLASAVMACSFGYAVGFLIKKLRFTVGFGFYVSRC